MRYPYVFIQPAVRPYRIEAGSGARSVARMFLSLSEYDQDGRSYEKITICKVSADQNPARENKLAISTFSSIGSMASNNKRI